MQSLLYVKYRVSRSEYVKVQFGYTYKLANKRKLTMAKIVKGQEVSVEDSALQEISSNDNEVVV